MTKFIRRWLWFSFVCVLWLSIGAICAITFSHILLASNRTITAKLRGRFTRTQTVAIFSERAFGVELLILCSQTPNASPLASPTLDLRAMSDVDAELFVCRMSGYELVPDELIAFRPGTLDWVATEPNPVAQIAVLRANIPFPCLELRAVNKGLASPRPASFWNMADDHIL